MHATMNFACNFSAVNQGLKFIQVFIQCMSILYRGAKARQQRKRLANHTTKERIVVKHSILHGPRVSITSSGYLFLFVTDNKVLFVLLLLFLFQGSRSWVINSPVSTMQVVKTCRFKIFKQGSLNAIFGTLYFLGPWLKRPSYYLLKDGAVLKHLASVANSRLTGVCDAFHVVVRTGLWGCAH